MKLGALASKWLGSNYGEAPSALAKAADLSLIGGSLAVAAGSVVFAGVMLTTDRPPGVTGTQYLAIFAQPKGATRAVKEAEKSGLDMAPVGAIGAIGERAFKGYVLVGAEPGFAWLREGDRVFSVRPGDQVARLGKVRAVEEVEGRWTVFGDGGSELISSASAASLAAAPAKPPPFAHRMILGPNQ